MAVANSAVPLDSSRLENEDYESWPRLTEVGAELGLSSAQLTGYVNRGWLVRYRCPDGVVRCRPLDVESFRLRLVAEERQQQQEQEETVTELKHVLRQTVSLLKQCQQHNERLWELHVKAPMTAIDLLGGIVRGQNERLQQMDESHDRLVRTREDLLNQAHERELMKQDVEARIKGRAEMMDRGLAAIEAAAPGLVELVGKNLGVKVGTGHPAVALMDSIDPELARQLLTLPILTPKQKELLRELFPDLDKPEAADDRATEAAAETQTQGEKS